MKCTLRSVTSVSHNTKLFTLELPAGSHMIVPIGYHVKIKAAGVLSHTTTKSIGVYNDVIIVLDDELIRSYTPILPLTGDAMEGRTINLLIKLYSDGRMSRYLSSLAVGKST